MSSNLFKRIGISAVFGGLLVTAGVLTTRAQADSWDKMTLLTFDQPTQIADAYLEPGTYMLKLANSDRHIVQIFTKDRSHLIDTIIAIPAYRVERTGETEVTFWETPPGSARAVRTWYYPGDWDGQEFRYPTQLRQIAAVTAPSAPAPALLPPPAIEPPAPQADTQTPAPAQEALNQATQADTQVDQSTEQQQVEIAQNTQPQSTPQQSDQNQSAADQSATSQSSASTPEQTLPQTASPYPLFGLLGALALGLYGALRFARTA